jgi:uncharacterized protein YdeI (YjbR/CyaY-like superfamily)
MPGPSAPATPTYFAEPALFRAWLEENHATATEIWVGFRKVGTGQPSITWPQAVDEALCYGWIDGVRKRVDDASYMIRFTPRRKASSIWSAVNVARVGELTESGRMRPAGLEAFARRSEAKTSVYSYEQADEASLAAGEAERFRGDEAAWTFFERQTPWYRRAVIHWVTSAKREETRQRRLDTLIADSRAGRTVGPMTRPGSKKADTG